MEKAGYNTQICPKDVDVMASIAHPDQTAPLGAV